MGLPNMHAATKRSGSNKAVWSSILQGLHRISFRKVMKVSNANFHSFQIRDDDRVRLSVRGIVKTHRRRKHNATILNIAKIYAVLVFWELGYSI